MAALSGLDLVNYLKIVSKGAVYNNLSEESSIWDFIKKKKKGPAEGRELRFLLRDSYGSGAVGFLSQGATASYPTDHRASINEGTAVYKDFGLTVDVERTLIAKALSDFSRYGEPLAEEMETKVIALSRVLSGSVYGDGTGVIVTVLSVSDNAGAEQTTVTLNTTDTTRGFIGWIEPGDKLIAKQTGGSTRNPTVGSGTFDHWAVVSRNRTANTFVIESRNSDGTAIDLTSSDLVAGDVLYRRLQFAAADTGINLGSITDHGSVSDIWAGLDSLSQDDGRVVNGITLSGSLGGTRFDAGGNPIDSQDFQQMMSQLMIAVGTSRYKYEMAMMAWETMDSLIESREVDRRFHNIEDNRRGVKGIGYVHGKNNLMFEADEWCPKTKIYCLPNADVLQFYGSDFEFVQPEGGAKFFLKPDGAGGHNRRIRAYMEGDGALLSVHSAGIGVIRNFTVA